ncbi:MAG: Stp1/IreP family PP2C-type Ser/Thr phosphatase [Candidatus Viridilinea halotolerans]|uniref:Stp1/IreP family PP2C-type Ser/Thr phosphatase n=1 Tax=Candidatus Viridilinea halotolerans TaxID=2491704 RepID=A0A426TWD9_9CHLR|nr:MAG: Stp1/IreP family PP2C-type Ser/Thr phosphatase [Candidatus Viridilinea halotolerans]
MHLAADTLDLRDLLAVVEAGVLYWRRRLASDEGVARERAAAAIKELSQILDSLAMQIAQGRETVRITSHLPAQRVAPRPCALCGRGNREQAKYCIACGAPLRAGLRPATSAPPRLQVKIAARSDVGRVRQLNEDTFYAGEFARADGAVGTLLLVADGMGGHQAGEVASALARDGLKQALTSALSAGVPASDEAWHTLLTQVVAAANQQIYQQGQRNAQRSGMGTTLTVALLVEGRAHLAHVGDSRIYLINAQGLGSEGATWLKLTTDHSLVARLVDIGQLTPAQARTHPQRNVVYRSLGSDPTVEVDTLSQALASGDQLLLCSDGLTSHVEDEELAAIAIAETSADRACERLIALANERGGSDNISVVLARV